jgi:hypothetical protein
LQKRYDDIQALKGENFNIFKILRNYSDEVSLHSRLLGELFNPNGSHSRGSIFLKLFIQELLPDFKFNFDLAKIEIEKRLPNNRRIDIFLSDNSKRCIIIENKIYAGDQYKQLADYYNYAQKTHDEENIRLIYLTLDGKRPDQISTNYEINDSQFICLSYKTDIEKWLTLCQKEVFDSPVIRETLKQYQIILKYLTNQSSNREHAMELKEILSQNKNYLQIQIIMEAFDELLIDSIASMFNEINEELNRKGMETFNDPDITFEKFARKYIKRDKPPYFGICIKTDRERIILKIQLDWTLYFGFAIFDDKTKTLNKLSANQRETVDTMSTDKFTFENNENKLYYKWPEITEGKINCYNRDGDSLQNFVNEEKRKDWIARYVDEVIETREIFIEKFDAVRKDKD